MTTPSPRRSNPVADSPRPIASAQPLSPFLLSTQQWLWAALFAAFALSTALVFGWRAAHAAACPNGTALFSGLSQSYVIAGAASGSITFNFTPPCGIGNSSQIYIALPAPTSGTNWTTPTVAHGTPPPSITATGGSLTVGAVYKIQIAYTDSSGTTEALPSATASWTIASTSTDALVIASPPSHSVYTHYYVYASQANGSTLTRQQTAGSPTATGTSFTISSTPSSGGAAPPSSTPADGTISADVPIDFTNAAQTSATYTGSDTGSIITINGTGTTDDPWIAVVQLATTVALFDSANSLCSASNWPTAGGVTAVVKGCDMSITWKNPTAQTLAATANTTTTAALFSIGLCNRGTTGFTQTCPTASTVDIATINAGNSSGGGSVTYWMGGGVSGKPNCTISGGGGTGATCSTTVSSAGAVTAVTLTAGGSGYTSTPTCTVGGAGSGSGATCTADGVSGGSVTGVTIGASGTDYVSCSACAQSLLVYPATASQYTVSNLPSSAEAGVAFSFVLTAADQYSNAVNVGPNNYADTATVTSNDPQAGTQQSVQFSNGVATSNVTLYTCSATGCGNGGTGTGYTFTITDTSPAISKTTDAVTVTASDLSDFILTPSTSTPTAGVSYTLTLKAVDAHSNIVFNGPSSPFTDTVAFSTTDSSTSVSIPANYAFTGTENGQKDFTVTLNTAGNQSVFASDQTQSGVSGVGAVTVQSGPATKLGFTTSPSGATGGSVFTTQPVVKVQDAGGNTISGATNSITLNIKSGTGASGATLSGTVTLAATNGVATFSGLSINKVSSGYQLEATTGGLTTGTSTAFTVETGSPVGLTFSQQPAGALGGSTFTTQPSVQVVDAGGNQAASSASITVAIGTNPSSGTLGGTTTISAVNGLAVFGTLSIDKAGTGYTLTATTSGLTGATSSSFNVTTGAAAALTFTTQPGGTLTGGTAFGTQPVVTITDLGGNTATGATDAITLVIKPGTGATGATLSGTSTVNAVAGVATFSGLSIDKNGASYKLSASGAGFAADSSAFTISIGPNSQITITTQPVDVSENGTMAAVAVAIRDAGGNQTTTTATVSVTLGNPGAATLTGTTSKAATSGAATFSDLQVSAVGTGYTLIFSVSGLSNTTSNTFSVVSFSVSVNPASGAAGTKVAVSGSAWAASSTITIKFGTLPTLSTMTTSPASCSASTSGTFGPCTITIPTTATGAKTVQITDGTSTSNQTFTVTGGAGVVITGMKPNYYYIDSKTSSVAPVQIKGIGMTGVTSTNQVLFVKSDGTTTPAAGITKIDTKSGKSMTVTPPALANAGAVHIEIITPHGNSDATDPNALFYYGPAILKGMKPNFGTVTEKGMAISGANFSGVTTASQVQFVASDGTKTPAASIVSGGGMDPAKLSNTKLSVMPPATGSGCSRVQIETTAGVNGVPAGGGGTSSIETDGTVYCWGPRVTSVKNNSALPNGDDPKTGAPMLVTITGGNFGDATNTTVKFGTQPACGPAGTSFVLPLTGSAPTCATITSTSIEVTVPAQATADLSKVDVKVTVTGLGTSAAVTGGRFTYGSVISGVKVSLGKVLPLQTFFSISGKNLDGLSGLNFVQSGVVKACITSTGTATTLCTTPANTQAATFAGEGSKWLVTVYTDTLTLPAGTYHVLGVTSAGQGQEYIKDMITIT